MKITPETLWRDYQEQRRYEQAKAEVRRVEKRGGEAASQGLWELIEKGFGERQVNVSYEAIAALGRLGRREDAPRIAQWARSRGPLTSKPVGGSVLAALGTIGGPDACQYFREFLDAIPKAHRLNALDVDGWTAAVRKAGCLSDEEVKRALWGVGRDRWSSDRHFQARSLEVLAGMGDEEAKQLLGRNKALIAEAWGKNKEYPIARGREVLLDRSVPWWVKATIFDRVAQLPGPKEDIFDIYFALAADVYENKPELSIAEWGFQNWGGVLVTRDDAPWTRTTPSDYLEAKRQELRASMSAEAFSRINRLIDRVLEAQRRWHEQRAEDGARENAKAGSKAAP